MAIPVSSEFDLFDWNSRFASTADAGDNSLVDVADGLSTAVDSLPATSKYLETALRVAVRSDAIGSAISNKDETLVRVSSAAPTIGTTFTFEFDISLSTDMPKDFDDDGHRIYVGVSTSAGVSAGFLFSYAGIAIAAHQHDTPTILAGSADYLFDDDGNLRPTVSIRATVSAGVMKLYIGATSEVYDSTKTSWADTYRAVISYELAVPSYVATYGSGLTIYASSQSLPRLKEQDPNTDATAGQSTLLLLHSLRVSSSVLVPPTKPTAVVSAPAQVQLNTLSTALGGNSFDANGLPLNFTWDVLQLPKGSDVLLSGATYSAASIGVEADDNAITLTHKVAHTDGNAYSLVLVKDTVANGMLSTALVGTVITVTLPIDGTSAVTATAADLVRALADPTKAGYNAKVAALLSADNLGTSDGSGLLIEETVLFSGGAGSVDQDIVFIPDVLGNYEFGLTVDNGVLYSEQTSVSMLVTETAQLLQHAPSGSFIFDYLTDFWKLVGDKEQLSTFWSAVTQVVASDTLIAWQNDYSKALRDLSRRFQRRWLSYSHREDLTGPSLVVPTTNQTLPVTVTSVASTDLSPSATYAGGAGVQPFETGKLLVTSSNYPPLIVDVAKITDANGTGAWLLEASGNAFPLYKEVTSNPGGYFEKDTTLPVVSPTVSSLFRSPTYELATTDTTHKIRLNRESGAIVADILSLFPNKLDNTVELSTSGLVDARPIDWDLVAPTTDAYVKATPYWEMPAGSDLSVLGLGLGDYAELELIDPYTAEKVVVYAGVLAVDKFRVFLDWRPVLGLLNASAAAQAQVGQQTVWVESDLGTLAMTLVACFRHKNTSSRADLKHVPTLGGTTTQTLFENTDYSVDGDLLAFTDVLSGTATTNGSTEVVLTDVVAKNGVDLTGGVAALWAKGLTTLVLGTGDAGVYQVVGSTTTGKLILDRPPAVTGSFDCWAPVFSYSNPASDRYWAELSYFDNWQSIQSNFGVLVGMPKELVDSYDPDVEYLPLIRGVWFAFVNGPSIGNLQLAVQAMFNLPFVERDGQIVAIIEATLSTEGTIVVDVGNGDQKAYRFPYGSTLAVNPATGRTITAYPLVNDTGNLTDVQAARLADSQVAAYTKLVDVVRIDDYISDPDRIAAALPGQEIIRKYHTFVVDVPLNVTNSAEVFPLVQQFLNEAKPAHTNFILTGTLGIVDDVDHSSSLSVNPTLKLRDTPHTAAFTALKTDAGAFGQAKVPAASELLLWPEEKTKAANGKIPGTVSVINGSNTIGTSIDMTTYVEAGTVIQIDNGGAFVAYTVVSATASDILLTGNYTGTPAGAREIWGTMQYPDVKEKYESGYVEGVLNDYSGDGSWNSRYGVVDMVNSLNPDIDVVDSHIWVPVLKSTGGAQDDLEFEIGELVEILDDTVVDSVSIWSTSPPIIVHIGAGVHPKIPFGVLSPQNEHPYTFIVLGFNHELYDTVDNFGNEARLDAIKEAVDRLVGPVRLVGKTSGAIATPTVYIDRDNIAHTQYFLLDTIFSVDKLVEWNPRLRTNIQATRYIPEPGVVIDTIQDNAGVFDTDIGTNPDQYLTAQKHSMQVQQHPYDPDLVAHPLNTQFVPSLGTGMYMDWDLTGVPSTKAAYEFRFGYTDVGDLTLTPTDRDKFTPDAALPIQNTHVGMRVVGRTFDHYTHGYTQFYIPAPEIKKVIGLVGAPYDIRLEGHYFVDDDSTRVAVPDNTASSFDGDYGGCWIFMREVATGTETAVVTWTFETGVNPGKFVIGVPAVAGAVQQTSTGHVLEFVVPPLTTNGAYDIIVRNYRPWQMKAGPPKQFFHMDEAIALNAYYHVSGGGSYVGGAWGTSGWGV